MGKNIKCENERKTSMGTLNERSRLVCKIVSHWPCIYRSIYLSFSISIYLSIHLLIMTKEELDLCDIFGIKYVMFFLAFHFLIMKIFINDDLSVCITFYTIIVVA